MQVQVRVIGYDLVETWAVQNLLPILFFSYFS